MTVSKQTIVLKLMMYMYIYVSDEVNYSTKTFTIKHILNQDTDVIS